MEVNEASVTVEPGDGFVIWPLQSGRVRGRVAGVLDINAESVEVLGAWAQKVAAECARYASEVESSWLVQMPWADVLPGDVVRLDGCEVAVHILRPVDESHRDHATHAGCLSVTVPGRTLLVEPSHEVRVRFPRAAGVTDGRVA